MFRSSAIVGRQRPAFRPPFVRFSPGAKMLLLLLLCGGALLSIHARTGSSLAGPERGAVTVQAADRGKPYFNLRDGRESQVTYRGEESLATALRSGLAQSRSLASIDLDRDGTPDVVVGYSYGGSGLLTLQRGGAPAHLTLVGRGPLALS